MNMYAYAGGNPVNRTDPTGLIDYDVLIEAFRLPGVTTGNGGGSPGGVGIGLADDPFAADVVVTARRERADQTRPRRGMPSVGATPQKDTCPHRALDGSCDSSGDPNADPQTLHDEQCDRTNRLDNMLGPIDDVATVASPASLLRGTAGSLFGGVGLVLSIPKIGASLGRLTNYANGTPCE